MFSGVSSRVLLSEIQWSTWNQAALPIRARGDPHLGFSRWRCDFLRRCPPPPGCIGFPHAFAALSRNRLHDEAQQNMRGLDRWVAHHGSKGRNVRDPFAAEFEHLVQRALHGAAPTRRGASRPSSTRSVGNRWRYQSLFLWA